MPAWHLRPRSAPEIVDASVQLLRQNARPLLILSTIVVIPGLLLGLANSLVMGDALETPPGAVMPVVRPGAFVMMLPIVVVSMAWLAVAFGALVAAASAAYVDGAALEPAAALRRMRARWGVLLGSGLLTYLIVFLQFLAVLAVMMVVVGIAAAVIGMTTGALGGTRAGAAAGGAFSIAVGFATMVGFLAAGAWLAGRYVTLPAVAVNETLGVRETMRRARTLSRGSAARVTALLLLLGVIFAVVAIGGVVLFGALLGNTAAAGALTSVVYVPLYAFVASLVAVLYYDLRVRHEGLDIELLAAELVPEPAAR